MSNNLDNVFLRLCYALRELKLNKSTTVVLGAGCSIGSTTRDISTVGIMRECLVEHGVLDACSYSWEALYQNFINIVWQGKAKKEQEALLRKKLSGIEPSDGHRYLRMLVENGFISTIITTNFDMVLEKAFEGLSFRKRVGDGDYTVIGESPAFDLLKVHGDLDAGHFRFAPHELMRLPESLSKDIAAKTAGLLMFIGYRGQDVGLMNSLCAANAYAVYWININEPNSLDVFSTKHIYDFMGQRESINNFLYGKEFGDFHEIMRKLHSLLLYPSHSSIIKSKETSLNAEWKNTSILEMLTIYTRIYEIFIDILNVSQKVYEKFCSAISFHINANNYNENLHAHLYFFNSKRLPANLLHIPNNEVDALVLGVSIEVLVRTFNGMISPKAFIESLRTEFEESNLEKNFADDSFWRAIEKIVCADVGTDNEVKLNMKNKLSINSYEIPLDELNELLRVVNFLSLLAPTTLACTEGSDPKYKIKQFLNGKYESIRFVGDKISINLGETSPMEADSLMDCAKILPGIHKLNEEDPAAEKRIIVFDSKWISIRLETKPQDDDLENQNMSLYVRLRDLGRISTTRYLSLGNAFAAGIDKHVALEFDRDIYHFADSARPAMFVVGASGSGKTTALQYFAHESNAVEEMTTLIVSPKNTIINGYGLSLFLGEDTEHIDEDILLRNVDTAFTLRDSRLFLIFDGLNEINETIEKQKLHYCKFLELAEKLHSNGCKNIKLILTCRESAYYQYRNASSLQLNPLYFYSNDKSEVDFMQKQDASYKIAPLNETDKSQLLNQYISMDVQAQLHNIPAFLSSSLTINDAITPFFIAIAGEVLNSRQGVDFFRNDGNLYDLFTNAMLKRIDQVDSYFARKIMYAYFDLVVEFRPSNMDVTKFKLMDTLPASYHNSFNEIVDKMADVNILLKDYSNIKRVKFQHDKIEEFFFKDYIEEYEYKGAPFFNSVFELSYKSVIYQGALSQYLYSLIRNGKLSTLKSISVTLPIEHMKLISKMVVEALSYSPDLSSNLEYLLSDDDTENSSKMLNVMIWGLDDSLQDYSIITCDLEKVIDGLTAMSNNRIINDETEAYLCYFKSKLYYFMNDYANAQLFSDRSIKYAGEVNQILLSQVNTHYSVILMELGFSKKSAELLEKEFAFFQKGSDLKSTLGIGIELGRALNHSGQVQRTLELYDMLLENEKFIMDPYVLARIYEQKANVLNNKMFAKLQYGFIEKRQLNTDDLFKIRELFNEAIALYNKAMNLLLKINALWSYSGVVPEKINTYISYSYSIKPVGVQECAKLIDEIDSLFINFVTPFKTDFYLAKAYYYEYIQDYAGAEELISQALDNALKLGIKNKEAKCYEFFSKFIYRRIISEKSGNNKNLIELGLCHLNKAIDYYERYTLTEGNIMLRNDIILRDQYQKIKT